MEPAGIIHLTCGTADIIRVTIRTTAVTAHPHGITRTPERLDAAVGRMVRTAELVMARATIHPLELTHAAQQHMVRMAAAVMPKHTIHAQVHPQERGKVRTITHPGERLLFAAVTIGSELQVFAETKAGQCVIAHQMEIAERSDDTVMICTPVKMAMFTAKAIMAGRATTTVTGIM